MAYTTVPEFYVVAADKFIHLDSRFLHGFEAPLRLIWATLWSTKIGHTLGVFRNNHSDSFGNNRAILLSHELECKKVSELETIRKSNSNTLCPIRPSWASYAQIEKAEP